MFVSDWKIAAPSESKGVVYTKRWVVDLLLELAGYKAADNLVDVLAVEPAAGEGAFLAAMVTRLVNSCRLQDRPLQDCKHSLIAFELDDFSAKKAQALIIDELRHMDIPEPLAEELAHSWIKTGDYLQEAFNLPAADFVIGNPPYVRLEDIPEEAAALYRAAYPTMRGRADLYVAFYEAALRQLKPEGICGFICADRWMLNQYGAELRQLVTSAFAVDVVIEMHSADAFDNEVSAYPAITIIRRGEQKTAVVASARAGADQKPTSVLTTILKTARLGQKPESTNILTAERVNTWFENSDPWPCSSPKRLALLRRLEEQYAPLEQGPTRVGIGVATGCDEAYITKDRDVVEESRLLKLALCQDTASGKLQWSGHYLINPWDNDGLVDLANYPRLRSYFGGHEKLLKKRHTAQKNPNGWFRTIDRVNHELITKPKLYIQDIKDQFNPVLDRGETYPHHNLYFVQSEEWDLEVLGGILLSRIGQLFIEAYGVRMRGGYLRFQAQYMRRIRVPNAKTIPSDHKRKLTKAFQDRDRELATQVALEIYGVKDSELETTVEY